MSDKILQDAINIIQLYEPFLVEEDIDTLLNIVEGLLGYIEKECGTVSTEEPVIKAYPKQVRWSEYE